MKALSQPAAAGIAICLYAIWNARSLMTAWLHSPYDRWGSIAFLCWIVPVIFLWTVRFFANGAEDRSISTAVPGIALAVSFAGSATDLSALKYLGMALSIAGFLPVRPATLAWLGCAAAWMPAAGWAFSTYSPALVNSTRAVIGLAALLLIPLLSRRELSQ